MGLAMPQPAKVSANDKLLIPALVIGIFELCFPLVERRIETGMRFEYLTRKRAMAPVYCSWIMRH